MLKYFSIVDLVNLIGFFIVVLISFFIGYSSYKKEENLKK